MWAILRVFVEFVIILLLFYVLFFWPLGMWAEKAMAPHFSTLAWKIAWTEEPGRLQSMGSLGVGHNWSDLAAAAGTWDLSSLTRDWTCTSCIERQIFTTGPPGKSLYMLFLDIMLLCIFRLQFSINITFTCTGKWKYSWFAYCGICFFGAGSGTNFAISRRSAWISEKEAPWVSVKSTLWEILLHNWVSATTSFGPLFSHELFQCTIFIFLVSPPAWLLWPECPSPIHLQRRTDGFWSGHKMHLVSTCWSEEQRVSLQGKTLYPSWISLKIQNEGKRASCLIRFPLEGTVSKNTN